MKKVFGVLCACGHSEYAHQGLGVCLHCPCHQLRTVDRPNNKVYLAGPMFGQSDHIVQDWRRLATVVLGDNYIIDPARRDMRGKEDLQFKTIVEDDKIDIDAASILLAYCPSPSAGTSMEIFYAWSQQKPVIVCTMPPVSPWIRYHARCIQHDMLDAILVVRALLNRGF